MSIIITLVSTIIVATAAVEVAPGITRIAQGYNIILGNPFEMGLVDPGLLSPIFSTGNFSDGNSCSLNGKTYSAFNGASCHSCISCDNSWKFSEYHGIQSYSKELSQSVSVAAKFGPFSFGASKSYQTVNSYSIQQQNIVTNAEIQCVVSCALLNYGAYPLFSTGFVNKVQQMPLYYSKTNKTNTDWFYDFFTNGFGTHYITSMQIGGRLGQYSVAKYYEYDTFRSSTYSVSLSADYYAANKAAKISLSTTTEQQQAAKWSQYSSDHSSYSYGATMPASSFPGDTESWQKQLFTNNAPIYIALNEIDLLLQPEYWIRYNMNDSTLLEKKDALYQAVDDYCNQYVGRNPSMVSVYCEHMPPNNAATVISVFKGMYYADPSGDYVNPYTLGLSCASPFEPVNWFRWNYEYAYICLYKTYKINSLYYDPMDYFGGVYTEECGDNNNPCTTYKACKLTSDSTTDDGVNPFTGKCSCPAGYSAARFKQSRASKNGHYYPSYWCYKKHSGHDYGVLAGFYATGNYQINNQFTKALSCPKKEYERYLMRWRCNNVKHNFCELYICLTNAWH